MVVDIAKYEINKDYCLNFFRTKGRRELNYSVSMTACITFVPAIVIAYWIGQEMGWPQEAIDKVIMLKKFYNYSEVLNKPEGSPV